MAIRISRGALRRILSHAAREPAGEVCGLLLARNDTVRIERIDEARETANVSPNPATTFEIDPRALFDAFRAERAGGPRIIGHYHSHPGGLPAPSARDAAMALQPGRLWLIVAGGEARIWREVSGGAMHGAFEPVELVEEEADDGCT